MRWKTKHKRKQSQLFFKKSLLHNHKMKRLTMKYLDTMLDNFFQVSPFYKLVQEKSNVN